VAHTFDELVAMQRAADEAHARVEKLRQTYGRPTDHTWSAQQTITWETAWRAWRDLARDVQRAIAEHAAEQGASRQSIEAEVERAARQG
jgi:hypothetical protein